LGRLRGFKQGKLDIIAKINRQRDLHARLLDELKEEERNLTEFLNRKAGTLPLEKVDFGSLRGRLPWPLRGEIISSFGRKKSTRFDTYTLNNGIKIRPQDSDEVRSVHGGEVIYSDYFKGYGNLLIIQHPGNYHSLYGHCDTFLKKSGDRVTAGDVVAQAGSSGSLSGKCLYFEIRQNLISQDPLLWLEKR
jgi:septal ring factor EnvC (AmiA/AmiB activator)